MAIVTLADFKVYVRDELAGADDASLTTALSAAHASVYEYCQRSFELASTASVRTYAPSSGDVLRIDDCTTVTVVSNNGVTVAAADWQAEPIGLRGFSQAPRPVEQVRLLSSVWFTYFGKATASITATWGWAATPPEAVEAVKILAKDIAHQRNNKSGVAGFGEFGSVRVRQNPYVASLLDPLRRGEAWGIG